MFSSRELDHRHEVENEGDHGANRGTNRHKNPRTMPQKRSGTRFESKETALTENSKKAVAVTHSTKLDDVWLEPNNSVD